MTPGLAKAWVTECTPNMTYHKIPDVPIKSDGFGSSKGKSIKKNDRRSSPWTSKNEGYVYFIFLILTLIDSFFVLIVIVFLLLFILTFIVERN